MLVEVSNVLGSFPYDVISLQSEGASSPCFLLLHFIADAINRNAILVLVTSSRSERAYRILASKAMVRLTDNIRFVSLGELFTDELDTADDTSFLNRLHESILSKIDNQSDEAFVMFDNLSLLCDVMRDPSSLVTFLRQLQISVHAKEIHPKLILTLQSTCDVSTLVLHKSDFVLKTKPIGSGFAKDVTGQLTIIPQANQETASTTILHYHLGDRSVHIFPPGLARPNL